MFLTTEKKYFIREEFNGITVYNIETNNYKFYENVYLKDIRNIKHAHEFENFLKDKKPSLNVKSNGYPVQINWLIEDKCNLDCIYCFASDKLYLERNREELIATAQSILNLKPLVVCLTGGEPYNN